MWRGQSPYPAELPEMGASPPPWDRPVFGLNSCQRVAYILCISYMHSDLVISQADRRPMYLQIMEQVRRRIAVGDWPPGHEIPSIRALAAAVRVSVITVKRAYLELERAGIIVTRQGKGSFVAETPDLRARLQQGELDEHLSSAVEVGRQLGLRSTDVEQRLRELWDQKSPDDAGKEANER